MTKEAVAGPVAALAGSQRESRPRYSRRMVARNSWGPSCSSSQANWLGKRAAICRRSGSGLWSLTIWRVCSEGRTARHWKTKPCRCWQPSSRRSIMAVAECIAPTLALQDGQRVDVGQGRVDFRGPGIVRAWGRRRGAGMKDAAHERQTAMRLVIVREKRALLRKSPPPQQIMKVKIPTHPNLATAIALRH